MELELLKRQLFVALGNDPGFQDLADRLDRLENFRFSDGLLSFDIIRHPNIEGLATKGMTSPGFFEVKELYCFDPRRGSVEFQASECLGIVIEDLHGLVDQDVDYTIDASHSEIERLRSEADVLVWASAEAARIGEILRETKDPPEEIDGNERLEAQWEKYIELYVECWRQEFKDQALTHWQELR